MDNCRIAVFSLLCVSFTYVLSLLLFTKGFLLKRIEVDIFSGCQPNFSVPFPAFSNLTFTEIDLEIRGKDSCWITPRYKKAVILIVDALRYDFAVYHSNGTSDRTSEFHYQNKLKVFHEKVKHKPYNSLLLKFTADPPTTTMQRLKGLTTGSLPTFVDASSNFASTEITEDNFIKQLKMRRKNITFMGDDTWLDLFPNSFNKIFDFPSFNVQDLHTVDNGVIHNLLPELLKKDWDVLIAHFLGVDHCGHRYGPKHPEMAEKLSQMDKVIRSVIDELSNDSVLFVFGDHGMTPTGDHGGDSQAELDAALFIYSPTTLHTSINVQDSPPEVSQIDLVPTLSLLLGLPVPYSNLGSVIEDLFRTCNDNSECQTNTLMGKYSSLQTLSHAMALNAHQVYRYLETYHSYSNDIPGVKLNKLKQMLLSGNNAVSGLKSTNSDLKVDVEMIGKLERSVRVYRQFLKEAKEMCQSVWAKFDITAMTLGMGSLVVAVLINMNFSMNISALDKTLQKTYVSASFGIMLITFMILKDIKYSSFLLTALLPILTFFMLVDIYKQTKDWNLKKTVFQRLTKYINIADFPTFVATLAVSILSMTFFSNSFVVHEDKIVTFLLQTLLFSYCYSTAAMLSKPILEKGYMKKTPGFLEIYTFLATVGVTGTGISASAIFRGCREEQWSCEQSTMLQPITALGELNSRWKNIRYLLSVLSVVLLSYISYKHKRNAGNLNDYSLTTICAIYSLPITCVCACLHWAIQALPSHRLDAIPVSVLVLFPRIIYTIVIVSIAVLVINPLLIFAQHNRNSLEFKYYKERGENLLPKLYNHVKMNWNKLTEVGNGKTERMPLVFGLANVYSAAVLYVIVLVTVVLMILLGDGLSVSLLLQVLIMGGFLELHAFHCCVKSLHSPVGLLPIHSASWGSVVCWAMIGSHFFYATGHQATITSIKWEAAFVGFHGDFERYMYPVAAALIVMNMFASHILMILGLPLLLLWPLQRRHFYTSVIKDYKDKDVEVSDNKGEFNWCENGPALRASLLKLMLYYILVHGLRAFAASGAAFILRRHLMVWKIFAPRFVVEGALFLLIIGLSPFVYLFVMRIHSALVQWVEKL